MRLTLKKKLQLVGYLFLMPFLLYFIVLKIFPFIYSIFLTFTNSNLLTGSNDFVGFKNYIEMLKDPLFYKVIGNTFYFAIPVVLGWLIIGFALALLLNRKLPGIGVIRFVCYVPVVIDWIIVSLVWMFIFDPSFGIVNFILKELGLQMHQFLQSTTEAMPLLIVTALWKGFGYYAIFYLAALQDIPDDFYDAADIDGAGIWSKFYNITIPQVAPVSVFVVLMAFINAFSFFAPFYLMTNGGPARSTSTVIFRYYEIAFGYMEIGRGSTLAMIFTLSIFIILLLLKRLLNRMSGAAGV